MAVLAGVSVDYYTRMEQGRDTQPSPAVIRSLADALRLGHQERSHLYLLTGQAPPTAPISATVRPSVQALLDKLVPLPAYVLTPRLDIAAWNAATPAVLLDLAPLPADERNLARLTLLDPEVRRLWVDWESVAREAVAQLRAATGRYPGDARLRTLVDELLVTSTEFAAWWSTHDVSATCHLHKHVAHPEVGELRFFHETLELAADQLQLIAYLPVDSATAIACSRLASTRTETMSPAQPRLRAVD